MGKTRRGTESKGTMQEGEEGMEAPRGEGRLGRELRRVRE